MAESIVAFAFLTALIVVVAFWILFYAFLGWIVSLVWNFIRPKDKITLLQGMAIVLLASIIGCLI